MLNLNARHSLRQGNQDESAQYTVQPQVPLSNNAESGAHGITEERVCNEISRFTNTFSYLEPFKQDVMPKVVYRSKPLKWADM